jgi:formylglycine-generating enzyme required for sulfatase activity
MFDADREILATDTILNGRYRIVRMLKHGGMGAVYEAVDAALHSVVALKQTFATRETQRKAFAREARLLANLDHEAFPRVMDHFFDGDGQYLVMELIRGSDLEELLNLREMPFPQDKVLEWADLLLDALEDIHSNVPPVIHRDIKPSNLILTKKGKLKLVDFGVAKGSAGHMAAHTSNPLSAVGYTELYASLEQAVRANGILGESLELVNEPAVTDIVNTPTDQLCDIYSLAATLYHLLTDQDPVPAAKRALKVWKGQPDPQALADAANPSVTAPVAAVLARGLAVDRSDRYPSAREMRRALREAVNAPAIPPGSTAPSDDLIGARARREAEAGRRAEEETHLQTEARLRREAEERERGENEEAERQSQEAEAVDSPSGEHALLIPPPQGDRPALVARTTPRAGTTTTPTPNRPEPATPARIRRQTNLNPINFKRFGGLAAGLALVLLATFGLYSWHPWRRSQSIENAASKSPDAAPGRPASAPTPTSPAPAPVAGTLAQSPLGMKFAYVPAGSFSMGSPKSEIGSYSDERPQHNVTISQGFYLGQYEVTQAEWQAVMGTNPSNFSRCGGNCPVERVSWGDVQQFLAKLNARNDGWKYSLPTEAEWEYAARSAVPESFARNLAAVAWYIANSGGHTHPVGQKQPNVLGLYDMHGNVWEWCQDWYDKDYYASSPSTDPQGPASGQFRVLRGGSWDCLARCARTAIRYVGALPKDHDFKFGFRVVASTVRTP